MKTVVIIPARMAATRLPDKPCLDIHGEPMVVRTWRQGIAANIGPVYVAGCGVRIEQALKQVGGRIVITDPALPKGTDRVYAGLKQIEAMTPEESPYDVIVNLQGDLPIINPLLLQQVLAPLADPEVDIATIAAPTSDPRHLTPSQVKIAMTQPKENSEGVKIGRALYFSRSLIPSQVSVHYHHIGVYAYRRMALEAFVNLPVSSLEEGEQLEQLRAMEAGMRIDVALVNEIPPSVDTPEDLEHVRTVFLNNQKEIKLAE